MVLVTGGTGYLGRMLVARLLARGERVRVFCRRPADIPAELRLGDIERPEDVRAAVRGARLVYHLAALVDHTAPEEMLRRINVTGTANVVRAARGEGVRRLVHCSTVSAEPGGGSTAYGRSKIAAETVLRREGAGLDWVILRPGPVYDGERPNLRAAVRFARRFRLVPRPLPDTRVHLASRGNVTRAFLLAAERGLPGKAYAVCDREAVPRALLVRILCERAGAASVPLPLPLVQPLLWVAALGFEAAAAAFGGRPRLSRRMVRMFLRRRCYDIRPAREDLGYDPLPTAEEFSRAVASCLASIAQEPPGENHTSYG
ncbi:MAG: NAD-dependent epimerase/dehydratase family protein [Desulfobacterales bacterium]